MKTVNKNSVCDKFASELEKTIHYIDRCREVFRGEDLYLSYCYEYAILQTYKVFEVFVMRIMISCLNHDHSCFEDKYGLSLGKHINDDVCEFLITKGGYFDFRGYDGLIKTLNNNLGNDSRFIALIKGKEIYKDSIEQLCAARNYAAHSSRQSKDAAKKAFNLQRINSAGSCLKQQNRYQSICNGLMNLAIEVKGCDIY